MEMVLVLTHLTGNEELDRQRAEEYCRYAAHKGKIPVSPFLCFHGIFNFNQAFGNLPKSLLYFSQDRIKKPSYF